MLTPESIMQLDLPLETVDGKACLYINAALDWLLTNTTLKFDKENIDSIKNLPSGAKVFLISFTEIMSQNPVITGESIAGMSQSFDTKDKNKVLDELGIALLGEYYSSVKFAPSVDKWRPGYECEMENREK